MQLELFIRSIPNFPIHGINYKDITPLLQSAEALNFTIEKIKEKLSAKRITKIVGIESRGFIFGSALAQKMNLGFVPIRKIGKLPYLTFQESYALEYGRDTLEIHQDALSYTDRVVLVDDLLATGGTALAAQKLIQRTGSNLEKIVFVVELSFLEGRKKFNAEKIISLIKYD